VERRLDRVRNGRASATGRDETQSGYRAARRPAVRATGYERASLTHPEAGRPLDASPRRARQVGGWCGPGGCVLCSGLVRKRSAASSKRDRSPVVNRSSGTPRMVAITRVAVRDVVCGSTRAADSDTAAERSGANAATGGRRSRPRPRRDLAGGAPPRLEFAGPARLPGPAGDGATPSRAPAGRVA